MYNKHKMDCPELSQKKEPVGPTSFTITIVNPEFGSIDKITEAVNKGGNSSIFTMTALYGSTALKLVIDGVEQTFASTYQFMDVQKAHTLSFTTTTSGTIVVPGDANALSVYSPDIVYHNGGPNYNFAGQTAGNIMSTDNTAGYNLLRHYGPIYFICKPNFTGITVPALVHWNCVFSYYSWRIQNMGGNPVPCNVGYTNNNYNTSSVNQSSNPGFSITTVQNAQEQSKKNYTFTPTQSAALIAQTMGGFVAYATAGNSAAGFGSASSDPSIKPYFTFSWSKY